MFSILAFIGALVRWIGGLVSLFSGRAQQKHGAAAQAGKETKETAKVETAIANAEANAPRTMDDVMERDRAGTF